MLIRFTVENFLSFNKRTEFNMIASAEDRHKHHLLYADKDSLASLLRASIIYGANASGKSNLIKAMGFAKKFIVEGVEKNKNIRTTPFRLNPGKVKEPSRFEFEFAYKERQFAYGFVTDKFKVHEEWLFEITLEKDTPIYERTGNDIEFNFSHSILQKIGDTEKARLGYEAESTRENLLFLTNTKERNIRYFDFAYKWFKDVLTIIFPESISALLPLLIMKERRFSELLRHFDFGIEGLSISEILLDDYKKIPEKVKEKIREDFPYEEEDANGMFLPQFNCLISSADDQELKVLELFTVKKDTEGNDVEFEVSEESDGTQRVIDLIPMMMKMRQGPSVFVIDEVERSLHTLLIRQIFELILNNEAFHGSESQIIASTHDVSLLDIKRLFRADEIWFVEKNSSGETVLYSLANTDVDDLNLSKGYLNGRFGAIPFLNDMSELGW